MTPRRPVMAAPRAVLLGTLFVVGVNAAILGSVAWNRGGAPRATLRLTERELRMPDARVEPKDELFLKVVLGHRPPESLRHASVRNGRTVEDDELAWFDRAKLAELGFARDIARCETSAPDDHGMEGGTIRTAYLALEFEGAAWAKWLADADAVLARLRADVARGAGDAQTLADAEARLAVERAERSRLFAIDAARDAPVLERRFAGRTNVVVVPGTVAFWAPRPCTAATALHGRVLSLDPQNVLVPHDRRPQLAPFLPPDAWDWAAERARAGQGVATWPAAVEPRYALGVSYGRAREPWIGP